MNSKGRCRSHTHVLMLTSLITVFGACGGAEPDGGIRIERVVELGDLSGEGALASTPIVSPRFPDGHYFVTTPWGYTDELVRVFDSTGRYVRSIGRIGDGPNEYHRPEFVRLVSDSAYIFDTQADRLTVLGEHDSTGESRNWTHRPYTFAELHDGTFVLSDGSWRPGWALQHVDREGELLGQLGDSVTSDALWRRLMLLAKGAGSGFWSGRGSERLEFQFWQGPDVPGPRLTLDRDWFTEHDQPRSATRNEPRPPSVVGFWPDSAGTLWIVATVPDSEWQEGMDTCRPGEGGLEYCPVKDRRLAYDGVIERVDAETGEQLLHRRFDEPFYLIPEPWIVATADENEDGWYQVTLWRVRE